LPVEVADIAALAITPKRTLLVATTTGVELTLWGWEDRYGWSRLLVEPSGSAVRVALAVTPTHALDQGVVVGLGRRVLRPLRHAQEVRQRERRPIWRAVDLVPDVVSVTSLAVSPVDRAVFAATNAGVFVSRDGGASFTEWKDGLANPRTVALAISPNFAADRQIYALGLGGTIWGRTDTLTNA
jgi:hypothetical protein